jgi:hypothetical protein
VSEVSLIYYAQCTGTGLIKIGTSGNVSGRLGSMQSGAPYELNVLATERGSRILEQARHRQFASLRLRGERFRDDGSIARHIAENCDPFTPPSRASKTLCGLTDDQIAEIMGCSRTYVTLMRLGKRAIPIDFALSLHAKTGLRLAPIEAATDDEIAVLVKFILAPLASERG